MFNIAYYTKAELVNQALLHASIGNMTTSLNERIQINRKETKEKKTHSTMYSLSWGWFLKSTVPNPHWQNVLAPICITKNFDINLRSIETLSFCLTHSFPFVGVSDNISLAMFTRDKGEQVCVCDYISLSMFTRDKGEQLGVCDNIGLAMFTLDKGEQLLTLNVLRHNTLHKLCRS